MTRTQPAPAQSRSIIGLTILLGSLTMFGPISIDMYLPALPAIAVDMDTNAAGAQRTLAAFLLGLAIGQLFYGPLSDRIGRRPPLIIGIALFIAASVGCAMVESIEALTVLRFIQALGAATGMVIARAVVVDLFPEDEAARMFSLLVLVLGLAPILAPIVGGRVLLVAEWPAIFFILAAFGTANLLAAWCWLSESRPQATADKARTESPLRAYLAVCRQRRIVGFGLSGALGGACFFTFIAASPDLLINTYAVSPQTYGWIFGVLAIGFVSASQVNRRLLLHFKPHTLLQWGIIGGLISGLVLVTAAAATPGTLYALLVPLLGVTSSLGFVMPNGVAGAMSVDRERSGTTAALVGALQFIAGATGAVAVGLFHDGSAMPMAVVIALAMALALAMLRGLVGSPNGQATL